MIDYSSNLSKVTRDLEQTLDNLRDADKVLRVAALDMQAGITSRIQQQGVKTDGTAIGQYKPKSVMLRKAAGRQTSYIDFTFDGDMMRNYIAAPTGVDEYSVGFASKREADKAQKQEDRFGKAFDPSAQEIAFAEDTIKQQVRIILNRK